MIQIGATPTASAAPLIEAIYQQGEILNGAELIPGFVAPNPLFFQQGDVVRSNSQGDIRALPNGNFIGEVNTNPQQVGIGGFPSENSRTAGISYLFGSDDRGATPEAFLREAAIGPDTQLDFVGDSGIDYQGNLSYAANLQDPNDPQISTLSSLWENQTAVLVEGDAIPAGPLSGSFFVSVGGVYRSPAGQTSWINSYSDTATGDAIGTALMRDTTAFNVLLESGDTIAGLGTLQTGGLGNIEWSTLGTNYILEVDVEPGFTSSDKAIAMNGNAVFTADGGLVREGQTIPAQDGGLPGEVWTGLQFLDVTEAGDIAFGAFTSGPDGQDDVVVVNGEVRYREGQMLDGVMLDGQPLGVGLNDRGDVAIAWNETLFINDKKVAGFGTLVDSDGDGVADAPIDGFGLSLGGLKITNLPAAGGDGFPVVYFSGEFNGGRDAYFRLAAPAPLDGDYNGDGAVDAADYTAWRDTDGSAFLLAADGDEDNVVDGDDFDLWAANLGGTPAAVAVPEPAAAALTALAVALTVRPRRVVDGRPTTSG